MADRKIPHEWRFHRKIIDTWFICHCHVIHSLSFYCQMSWANDILGWSSHLAWPWWFSGIMVATRGPLFNNLHFLCQADWKGVRLSWSSGQNEWLVNMSQLLVKSPCSKHTFTSLLVRWSYLCPHLLAGEMCVWHGEIRTCLQCLQSFDAETIMKPTILLYIELQLYTYMYIYIYICT